MIIDFHASLGHYFIKRTKPGGLSIANEWCKSLASKDVEAMERTSLGP